MGSLMKNLLSKVKMPGSKSKQKNKNSNNAPSSSEANSKDDTKDDATSSTNEGNLSKLDNPQTSKSVDEVPGSSQEKDMKFKDLKKINDISLADSENGEEKILDSVKNVESTNQVSTESNSVENPEITCDSTKPESITKKSKESVIEDTSNFNTAGSTQ